MGTARTGVSLTYYFLSLGFFPGFPTRPRSLVDDALFPPRCCTLFSDVPPLPPTRIRAPSAGEADADTSFPGGGMEADADDPPSPTPPLEADSVGATASA